MRIAVVDTTFAPVDMATPAIRVLREEGGARVDRVTVPGIKDIPVAMKRLLQEGCESGLALGTPGPKPADKTTALVASMGLQLVQLATDKPVLEVFVHLDEAGSPAELQKLCQDRAVEHARNAIAMQRGGLSRLAGTGQRQGGPDVGPARDTPGWTPASRLKAEDEVMTGAGGRH